MPRKILFLMFTCSFGGVSCSTGFHSDNGIPNVTVKVSPVSATLAVHAQQQFTASVSGSSSTTVNWSVGGIACAVQDCGSITAGGLYTAPGIAPSPNQVTITAEAQVNALDSGSAEVLITATGAVLNGAYTFLLLGTDANGRVSMAGEFFADGVGNLNDGELTLCRSGQCNSSAFTGRYTRGSARQGALELDTSPRMLFSFAEQKPGRLGLDVTGEGNLQAAGIMQAARRRESSNVGPVR